MKKHICRSDSMEPAIDFGDTILILPTGGAINADGMYLFLLDREHIRPKSAQRLCAPVLKVIWRVARLGDGRLALTHDNPGYSDANSIEVEAEFLSRWRVAGRVVVRKRNGRGFRTMSDRQPTAQAVEAAIEMEVAA